MSILLPFYDDLQAWLDDGCPDNQIFDQRTGLCETLKRWARLSHIKYINIPHPILKNELEHQFETAHLCKRIPFNKDVKEYWKELSLGAIYQNPHRVAWINKHASKTLKQFYREIQAWIDDGCPVHDVFDQSTALCETLNNWSVFDDNLEIKLVRSFTEAGLDKYYPFNNGNEKEFENDKHFYQNPTRLAWIKEHTAC